MTTFQYLKDVVTLAYDEDKCIGCGMCEVVCPHGVFIVESGKARITDRDNCMECGACEMNCPVEAITVRAGVGCAAGIIAGTYSGSNSDCNCSVNLSQLQNKPSNGNHNRESGKSCCGPSVESEKDNKGEKPEGGSSCGCC